MEIEYNEGKQNTEGNLGFIHRFLLPAENDTTHVTLLLLHGTGGDENDLIDLGRILLPGAAMLSPRGGVLENGMARFFRRHAEGVLDVPDLLRRTEDLANFIQTASTTYRFDAQRVIAVGFSNGANIAGSMLLRRPEMLAGAILLHPMVPFEPEQFPDLAGKPIFIGAGQRDPLVPVSNTQRLIEIFKQAGANVTESWANGGHTITHEELRGAQSWIKNLPFIAQTQ